MRILLLKHLIAVLGLTFSTGFASAKNLNPVGSWLLADFVIISANGDEAEFCRDQTGIIIYERNGYMSVSINCGPNQAKSVPAEKYGNQLFYAGPFEVKGNLVAHRITNSSFAGLIGKELIRKIETLSSDTLTLTGAIGNEGETLRIVWTRE